MSVNARAFVGTAGWSIGRAAADSFPPDGSGLERYAKVFDAVEINSSFYRSHRPSTWERWQDAVPAHFRFSMKVPKTISHEMRLIGCEAALERFVGEVRGLGEKLGVVLLQLPPKLEFHEASAVRFFAAFRSLCSADLVCEPRHASWFEDEADEVLRVAGIARVAADPARHVRASTPGGWRGLSYFRLHGSPVMYRSSYGDRIELYGRQVTAEFGKGRPTWCIFDNTASSAAISDALLLQERISRAGPPTGCI